MFCDGRNHMLENWINNVKIIRVIFSLYYATWQLYTFWNMRRMKTVTTYFFVIYRVFCFDIITLNCVLLIVCCIRFIESLVLYFKK